MIYTSAPTAGRGALTPAERHGLSVLLDLSRLLQTSQPGNVVHVYVTEASIEADLAGCLAKGWHLQVGEGTVGIPRGVLRLVTNIVAAVDEQRSANRDRYGRVPPQDNLLVRLGATDDPVVARAAATLRAAVHQAASRRPVILVKPWPNGCRWAVALTHDLDVVSWWPGFTALRVVELLRKAQISLATRVMLSALGSSLRNPVESAARSLLNVEDRSVPATWFILCGTPSLRTMATGDLTYRPESKRARSILGSIRAMGHEIGLHGSFASYDREEVFREQRARLARIADTVIAGVRQHFLRMVPGATQRAMSIAGFEYDSTFGFADRNGFRLGVSDVVPMWSEADQKTLAIDEAPFAWMDRTMSKYQGIESPAAWVGDGLRGAQRVRETEGLWVGIWHPNLDAPLGYPDALAAFEILVARLIEMKPFLTTLPEAVRWRRNRRRVRAAGVQADGTVGLILHDAGPFLPELETPAEAHVPNRVVKE